MSHLLLDLLEGLVLQLCRVDKLERERAKVVRQRHRHLREATGEAAGVGEGNGKG